MPNPDFAYANAYLNLKNGPLLLKGTMPDSTYWSVAIYNEQTENVYVKNDKEFGSNNLELTIVSQQQKAKTSARDIFYSPVTKGFLLIRILITNPTPEKLQEMEAYLKTMQITSIQL